MRILYTRAVPGIAVLCLVLAAASDLQPEEYRVFDEETLFNRLHYKEKLRYNSLQYILNDHQKKQYLSLETWDERDEWLRRFWLEMDPTPTTNHNERKKEHFDRVELAVEKYGCEEPPGWDDRGIYEGDENSRYRKGNLIVVPYPLHLYRKSFPIAFYFEIYGIDLDKEDFGFYEVEYSVTPTEKKRWGPVFVDEDTGISTSFKANGFGSQQPMRLEINTDNLWSGRFVLRVKVTDRRTRKSTEQTASFAIIDQH